MNYWLVVSPAFITLLCVVSFSLGWLFPVEGPLDFVYDNYMKKTPVKAAPLVKTKVKDLEDPCEYMKQEDPYFLLYCREVDSLD